MTPCPGSMLGEGMLHRKLCMELKRGIDERREEESRFIVSDRLYFI